MQVVPRSQSTFSLSPVHAPVLTVDPGEEFRVECPGAGGGIGGADGTWSVPAAPQANPMAGPVAVRGAIPGESVAVTITGIAPVGYGLSSGLVYTPAGGRLRFLDGLSVPAAPSIGCFGAAPKLEADATDNMDCGPHGGNFDCADAGPGATIFLRVRVPGANLGFGDVHWAMGDGELVGTGVEGAADAVVTVRRARAADVEWPWIIRGGRVMTMGAAPDLRIAQRIAYEEMMTLCRTLFDLERTEVNGRVTVAGDLRICQSVCPKITVRFSLPLELLGTDEAALLKRMVP